MMSQVALELFQALREHERTTIQYINQLRHNQQARLHDRARVELLEQQTPDIVARSLHNINPRLEQVSCAFERNKRLDHQNDLARILDTILTCQQNRLKNDLREREILEIRRAQPAAIQSGDRAPETVYIAVLPRYCERRQVARSILRVAHHQRIEIVKETPLHLT